MSWWIQSPVSAELGLETVHPFEEHCLWWVPHGLLHHWTTAPKAPHPWPVNHGHIPSSPASNQNTINSLWGDTVGGEVRGGEGENKTEIAGRIIGFLGQREWYNDWLIQDGSPQAVNSRDGGKNVNKLHPWAYKEMFSRHFHWCNITPVCFCLPAGLR